MPDNNKNIEFKTILEMMITTNETDNCI